MFSAVFPAFVAAAGKDGREEILQAVPEGSVGKTVLNFPGDRLRQGGEIGIFRVNENFTAIVGSLRAGDLITGRLDDLIAESVRVNGDAGALQKTVNSIFFQRIPDIIINVLPDIRVLLQGRRQIRGIHRRKIHRFRHGKNLPDGSLTSLFDLIYIEEIAAQTRSDEKEKNQKEKKPPTAFSSGFLRAVSGCRVVCLLCLLLSPAGGRSDRGIPGVA